MPAPTSSAASSSSRPAGGRASGGSSSPRPAARSTASPREAARRPRIHPTNPVSPYGCAKLSIEKYLFYYREIHGFETQVFRYANVYGPWQDGTGEAGVVAIFAEAILSGKTPKIRGDGEQTRDYVYVGDLVSAAARAVEQGGSGTWNLGTGVETSVNRLFELLAGRAGYKGKPEHVALPPGEQRRSVLNGSLVQRELNLTGYTKLADGLKDTAEFFRQRHQTPRG